MCELVTPHVAQGGVRTAYVMVSAALAIDTILSSHEPCAKLTFSPISCRLSAAPSVRSNTARSCEGSTPTSNG